MKLSRRERVMIIVGSVVIVSAAYIFYFMVPNSNARSDAATRLRNAQTLVNQRNQKETMTAELDKQISELTGRLKSQGGSIPAGIDHARILLYLKQLTDKRATEVNVAVPSEASADNGFLTQAVTVEFTTTYPNLQQILNDLGGGLYNRVTYLKADYVSVTESTSAPASSASPSPTPVATVTSSLKVHIELTFYSLPAALGGQPSPALTPTNTDKPGSLFPN